MRSPPEKRLLARLPTQRREERTSNRGEDLADGEVAAGPRPGQKSTTERPRRRPTPPNSTPVQCAASRTDAAQSKAPRQNHDGPTWLALFAALHSTAVFIRPAKEKPRAQD